MSLDMNTAMSIAAAVGAIIAAIVGILLYLHSTKKFVPEQYTSDVQITIMNNEQKVIFDINSAGKFTKLSITINQSQKLETYLHKVYIHFISDDTTITKTIQQLIQSGDAYEKLAHMHGDRTLFVNFIREYDFYKHGKLIFENQTNQGFSCNWLAEIKRAK